MRANTPSNESLPTRHDGDLTITKQNLWKFVELTEVSGSVDIHAEGVSLPALTEVSGYAFELPTPELARDRLAEVARHALATPKSLNMQDWHTCNTTHCVAGWAVHLAGAEGYELERKVGPSNAGLVLLGPQAAAMFYLPRGEAKQKLEEVLAQVGSA